MLLVEEEAGDGRGGGDEGRSDDLEALFVIGLLLLMWSGGKKKGFVDEATEKELISFSVSPCSLPLSFALSLSPSL